MLQDMFSIFLRSGSVLARKIKDRISQLIQRTFFKFYFNNKKRYENTSLLLFTRCINQGTRRLILGVHARYKSDYTSQYGGTLYVLIHNPTSLSLRIVSAAGRNSLLHFMTSDRPLLEHTRLAYQDETTGKLMDHYFFFLLRTTCISSGDQLNQRRIGKHSMPS